MYEPVLTDEKLDLYNVYEVHKNYRILAMAVNVPLQVAEEICHILNNFEPVILKTCPICDQSVTINEYISDYLYSINCECCGLKTRRFRSKQNLIKYWNATGTDDILLDNNHFAIYSDTLLYLLTGIAFVKKKPFCPKYGEMVYYVTVSGYIQEVRFDTDSTLHQLLRKAGKLYRSEEEAKRYLDKDYKDLIIQEEE
jgi:hypothetical protein